MKFNRRTIKVIYQQLNKAIVVFDKSNLRIVLYVRTKKIQKFYSVKLTFILTDNYSIILRNRVTNVIRRGLAAFFCISLRDLSKISILRNISLAMTSYK